MASVEKEKKRIEKKEEKKKAKQEKAIVKEQRKQEKKEKKEVKRQGKDALNKTNAESSVVLPTEKPDKTTDAAQDLDVNASIFENTAEKDEKIVDLDVKTEEAEKNLFNDGFDKETKEEPAKEEKEDGVGKITEITKPYEDDGDSAWDSVRRGLEIAEEIRDSYPTRLLGSKGERKTANFLLKRTEETFKTKGKLEPFYVKSFAYNYGMLIYGAFFVLTLLVYYFSPITAVFINLMGVIGMMDRMFFKVDMVGLFDKKSTSFNVVNEIKSKGATKNTLILTSNYSTSKKWNFTRLFKVNLKAFSIISMILLLVEIICLIVIAAGINNLGLIIFTGIMVGFFMIFCFAFYGYGKKNCKNVKYGLTGVGMNVAIVDYLSKHRELIGDGTRVVFCCFGGGTDGANGSRAFIKEHFKINDDYKKAVAINFEAVANENEALYLDVYKRKHSKGRLAKKVYEGINAKGVNKETGVIKGYAATNFGSIGVDSVGIGVSMRNIPKDFNNEKDDSLPSQEEFTKRFNRYLGVVEEILEEMKTEK